MKCPLGVSPDIAPGTYEDINTIAYNTNNISRRNKLRAQNKQSGCDCWYN